MWEEVLCDDGRFPMMRGRLTKNLCNAVILFGIADRGNVATLQQEIQFHASSRHN